MNWARDAQSARSKRVHPSYCMTGGQPPTTRATGSVPEADVNPHDVLSERVPSAWDG
jgi:hypothetical protein